MGISYLFGVIVRMRVVFGMTVVGDWRFNYQSGIHLTLKMTTAQVVETSVINNSLSKDYPHPDDHARQILRITVILLVFFCRYCIETSWYGKLQKCCCCCNCTTMRFLLCGRKYCKLIMYTQEILLTILRLVLKDCIFAEMLDGWFRESGKSERR